MEEHLVNLFEQIFVEYAIDACPKGASEFAKLPPEMPAISFYRSAPKTP